MLPKVNTRVLYTVFSALIIIIGTIVAIEYAKGNFRVTRQGFLREAGLLSANSFPTGAEVYIDGKLVSATDDTLYLEPGEYEVEIIKDGYWPWKKTIQLEQELVTQTNAQLFPIAPSLAPLTSSGVDQVLPSPDGQKLLYVTSSSSQNKNGLYVLELSDSLLSLQRGPRQLADLPQSFTLDEARFIWSPDSSEVIILTENREVLVDVNRKQNLDTLPDISFSRKVTLAEWEEEMYLRERQFLQEFPEEVVAMATTSAKNVYISPDKKRLMYTAQKEITLPEDLVPPVPARNSQPQARELEIGGVYIYDREEDTNFFIGHEETTQEASKQLLARDLFSKNPLTLEASPSAFQTLQATTSAQTANNFNQYHTGLHNNTFQWFPDSKHILYSTEGAIRAKTYDNTNDTTVYSGPFSGSFVYPWPDGEKVIILTTFNPESPVNLYAIDL